jgi:hypothetical protein
MYFFGKERGSARRAELTTSSCIQIGVTIVAPRGDEMNATGPKLRATFSIDREIKGRLERVVPKTKRSSFVEEAIASALRELAKQQALKAIRDFKPYPLKGPGTVKTLRQARAQRDEQLASRHRPLSK